MAGYPVEAEVVLTDKLKRYFRSALTKSNLPDDLRKQIRIYTSGRRHVEEIKRRTVPYDVVKSVHTVVSGQEDGRQVYLHDLLKTSDVHIPEMSTAERNPELEARIQQLKNIQANKEYAQMTRNVDNSRFNTNDGSVRNDIREVNNQLIAVLNFLLTVIGSFVFVYKATEYSMEKPNVPVQLCSGLVAGTIVFFADLYFLIKNTI